MSNPSTPLSFSQDDAFGWESFADRLKDFLRVEKDFVDGSLVVSLDAPFGSGKSHFLSMWKHRLDAERESDPTAPVCVVLNAWEDDYCGDPLLSLVHAIDAEVARQKPDSKTQRNVRALKEAAADVLNFGLGLTNSFVSNATGVDPEAAGEFAEKRKAKRAGADPKTDVLQLYRSRRGALDRLKESLTSMAEHLDAPVLLMVDELDRCRPDFAIQYLETIKHLFDIKGLNFILAVDAGQLENSARALFGEGLNFDEYYRKFAHWRVTLPRPSLEGIRKLVTKFTGKYLDDPAESDARRKSMLDLADARSGLVDMSLQLGLAPRQLQEAFRIIGHLAALKSPDAPKAQLYYFISASSMLLAFLSVGRPEDFRKIASGGMTVGGILDIVVQGFSEDRRQWWALLLVSMLIKRDEWEHEKSAPTPDSILQELAQRKLIDAGTTAEQLADALGKHSMNFHRGSHTLRSIARRILELERFAT
jgi:hypothetical protein